MPKGAEDAAYFGIVRSLLSPRRAWWLLLPVALGWTWVSLSGYTGLNGQDAHDYLRIALAWDAWTEGGERPLMAEHPHGYPIAGVLLGTFLGTTLGLRLVSVLAFAALVFTQRATLRRAFPAAGRIDAFVLLAFACAPFLLRYALMVMSDVPALALLGMAYACTLRWIGEGRFAWLATAIAVAVLALCVRLAAAPVIALLALAWVHGPARGRRWRWMMAAGLAILGVVAALVLVPWPEQVTRSPLAEWSPLNLFRRELHSDDGALRYAMPNGVYVLSVLVHPGFLPIGLLLLPFVRRADLRMVHARVALLVAVGYLAFVAGMPFQNDRVLLMAQPFVAVLLFPAFTRAMDHALVQRIGRVWVVLAIAFVQSALFVRAMLPAMGQAATERMLATQLKAFGARRVYTHGMGAAFNTWCPGVEVTELWYGTIRTFEPGAFVVVVPRNLADQWQGRPPAINWERIKAQGIDTVFTHPDGWVVARIR